MSVSHPGTAESSLPSPVALPPTWRVVQVETVALDIFVIGPDGKPQRAWLTFAVDDRTCMFVRAAVGPADELSKELVCLADGQGILRRVAALAHGCVGQAPLARVPGPGKRGFVLREPVTVSLDSGFGQEAVSSALAKIGCDVVRSKPYWPGEKGRAERMAQAILRSTGAAVPSRIPVLAPERCRAFMTAALANVARRTWAA